MIRDPADIEFRGFDKDTNRWYFGYYVRLERTTPYAMAQDPQAEKAKFEAEQVDHYIFFTQSTDWGLPTRKLKATVDPKSVGEYAGLRDQKRHKIYEGDIIHNSHIDRDRPGLVEFSNIHHSYRLMYPKRKTDSQQQWDYLHGTEHCFVIIGNLFENSELLK